MERPRLLEAGRAAPNTPGRHKCIYLVHGLLLFPLQPPRSYLVPPSAFPPAPFGSRKVPFGRWRGGKGTSSSKFPTSNKKHFRRPGGHQMKNTKPSTHASLSSASFNINPSPTAQTRWNFFWWPQCSVGLWWEGGRVSEEDVQNLGHNDEMQKIKRICIFLDPWEQPRGKHVLILSNCSLDNPKAHVKDWHFLQTYMSRIKDYPPFPRLQRGWAIVAPVISRYGADINPWTTCTLK